MTRLILKDEYFAEKANILAQIHPTVADYPVNQLLRQVAHDAAIACHKSLATEIARLKKWVADLQDKTYVTCVYCGHRYGPNDGTTPTSHAEMLKSHIAQCPEHPMSEARQEISDLEEVAGWAQAVLTAWNTGHLYKESLLHKKLREVMINFRARKAERAELGQILDGSDNNVDEKIS